MSKKEIGVVAFGGNALLRREDKGTFDEQQGRVYDTLKNMLPLFKKEMNLIITHGNGPQVGNILLQNEGGFKNFQIPINPLHCCGSETQGMIGYMIEKQLRQLFFEEKIKRDVICIVTQVEVDAKDPKFSNPTKPVGPFYSKVQADELKKQNPTWLFKEVVKNLWRRVVASPMPLKIGNVKIIEKLAREGTVVICVGGGGIPVCWKDGKLKGMDAVIDKDLASSVLATKIKADMFIILTDVEHVLLNFGKKDQKKLTKCTVKEMKKYSEEGHFKEGSMKPKISACVRFVEMTNDEKCTALITDSSCLKDPKKGTVICLK